MKIYLCKTTINNRLPDSYPHSIIYIPISFVATNMCSNL